MCFCAEKSIESVAIEDLPGLPDEYWIKWFAIGLIKQNPSKESMAMQRRMAGWSDNYLTQLLSLSAP